MKILLIKLGAIGDVIQTAAAVRIFLRRNPTIHLDWVVSSQLGSLVKAFGVANEVIEVNETEILTGNALTRLRTLLHVIAKLACRRERYDRIVTAYSDWRYELIGLGVRSKSRVRFKAHSKRPSPIHHRNRVFEYWRLLSDNDNENFDIAQTMTSLSDSILSSPSPELIKLFPKHSIALVPGGARNLLRTDNLRRWPVENYRVLTQRLLSEGHSVVLVGGRGDVWASKFFFDLPVVDLIGKTSLPDLIHLFDRADVVVSHDCGPMHMAAISHSGLVALFGPTPPNAFLPFARERTVILHEGNRIACCPCYDGRNYAKCSKAVCMDAISVERVFEVVISLCTEKNTLP